MDLTISFFASVSFVLIGIAFIAYAATFLDAQQVNQRIHEFILEDQTASRVRSLDFRELNFSESFLTRMLAPSMTSLVNLFGRFTPANSIQETNRRLAVAGIHVIKAQQLYGIRVILMLGGVSWLIFDYSRNPDPRNLLVGAGVVLFAFIVPILWVRWKYEGRREEIQKSLAEALDMLSVSTAAGLGFDQALMKVSQYSNSATGEEFARVVSEIEIGVSRQQALRNFAERVQISEISSFVAVIIQSELLGMSIADVLKTQADQMRIQRQYRAKEMAQKLPVKMMVPLALLIFPALLAVLLGPTIPAIMEIF